MQPFSYGHAADRAQALTLAGAGGQYLAGGTTLVDLMKLDVMTPVAVVDINALAREHGAVAFDGHVLRLGALARMADVAEHADVRREFPVIAQSLDLAASPQIRNMASLGGNVLQRTRCNYFRDIHWSACNKRKPGSGCAAMEGVNRKLGVLGVSGHCLANYPGDFATALAALDALVELESKAGRRVIPFEDLHRLPGDTPHLETNLKPGELITGFSVPVGPWARRSLYLKIRDRQSYEFALASAAVALDLDGDGVRAARIGLGGVAAKPWRSHAAEAALTGHRLDETAARRAADAAFAGAITHGQNAFRVELGKRTLTRALLQTAHLEF